MNENELDIRLAEIERKRTMQIEPNETETGDLDFRPTDTWNAQLFVSLHKDEIRYCHDTKLWLIWDGKRWREDNTERITELAKKTVGEMYRIAGSGDHEEERKRISRHAQSSESDRAIRAMVNLARSDELITVNASDLNQDPLLFNCQNGTVDLRTGRLLPHNRDDLITKISPVLYDPQARSEAWEAYVDHVMADNQDMIKYLQIVSGYALTGEAIEECIFVFYGPGGSGKSTFLETITEIMGDYAGGLPTNVLIRKKHVSNGPAPELISVRDKRVVTTVETGEDQKWDEPLVKLLTGGDTVTARGLFSNRFISYRPGYKIFMATNYLPGTDSMGSAMKRRLKLIRFPVSVPEDDQDPRFKRDLRSPENLPGVLNWMIQGAIIWLAQGLTDPSEIKEAYQDYQSDNDALGEFIETQCIIHPELQVTRKAFMAAYKHWCDLENIEPRGSRFIVNRLRERGFIERRTGSGGREWLGIGLRSDCSE